MTERLKSLLLKVPVLSGYLCFILLSGRLNLSLAAALALLLGVVVLEWRKIGSLWMGLTPFASGCLGFVARIFYWDRFDFSNRMDHLLLISLLFSLGWFMARFRLVSRLLDRFKRLTRRRKLLVIFLAAEIFLIAASTTLVRRGITLVGDEAHYLVISHSIARDGDVNVFNQYAREEYRDFYPGHLQSHAKVGRGFKKWYSFHLPGLSLTLSPFFLMKIPHTLLYPLIRIYLGIFGALLAVLVFLFSMRLWKRESLSLGITAVFCLTSPVVFLSIHVFAEVQALLLILSSLYLVLFRGRESKSWLLLSGFLLGMTVFWGMKYIIFIALFTLGFALHFIRKREAGRIIWFALFPLLFLLLFFGYLFMAYGNLSPMSVYTGVMTEEQARHYYDNVRRIPLKNRLETLMDYFFDQRDGLLPYNPFYFFFFPGIIMAFRKIRKYGNHLLVSAAGFVYLLYHGYSTVRPGVCPQARYLVPVCWILMLFAVIYYLETRNRFMKRVFWLVPFYSFFVVLFQVMNPYTLYQSTTHDFLYRPGLMFQKWSNLYVDLSGLLPSFIKSVPSLQPPFYRPSSNADYVPNIIGLLLLGILVLFALSGWKRGGVRWLVPVAFGGLVLVFVLFPRVSLFNPVLVDPPGALPHLVHGEAFHPGKAEHKRLIVMRDGVYRWLVSTRRQAGYMRLALENRGGNDLKVEMFNFDSPVSGAERLSPGRLELVLDNPRFRRHRGRCYYQFTFRITGGIGGEPFLTAECLPFRR